MMPSQKASQFLALNFNDRGAHLMVVFLSPFGNTALASVDFPFGYFSRPTLADL